MKIKNKNKTISINELKKKVIVNSINNHLEYNHLENNHLEKHHLENKNYYNNSKFNLVLKNSNINSGGLGVYTLDFIPENTIIGEYEGESIETFSHYTGYYFYELQELDIENNKPCIGIDAEKYPRCYMAMINDANYKSKFTNNCYLEDDLKNKKVYVISDKDIEKGEELFVDYGIGYWKYFELLNKNEK